MQQHLGEQIIRLREPTFLEESLCCCKKIVLIFQEKPEKEIIAWLLLFQFVQNRWMNPKNICFEYRRIDLLQMSPSFDASKIAFHASVRAPMLPWVVTHQGVSIGSYMHKEHI